MAQYGVTFVATVYAYDSTAGTYKTGDSANIALRWTKDGTNAATTNAVAEVDATNSPGLYKVTMTAAEATCTAGQLSGKSSTGTNIIISGAQYHFDTYTTVVPAGTIPGIAAVDSGTGQAGATGTTFVLRSAAAFADSQLVGHTISLTGGTGAGQSRLITAYTGATDTATVDTWTTTPDNTSTYIVYPTPPGSASSPAPSNMTQILGTAVSTPATAGILDINLKNIANATVSASTAQLGVNVVSSVSNYGIKKNTALTAYPFLMTDSTTHAPATGLTVTATRSIDGAAFGACANAVSEIASGWYKITLAAADLNGGTIALKFAAAGADQANHTIVTAP